MDAAIRRRVPSGAPPLRVPGRRIFILPTKTGALFATVLIVMLLGATNYGNNLAFTLTFWLGAAALVSMHRAHRNLAGLYLRAVHAEPVFAGQDLVYTVTLASDARLQRRGLRLRWPRTAHISRPVRVRRDSPATIDMPVPTRHRGWQACPALHIESRYPMGLFRCWIRLAPTAPALVYPRPSGAQKTPLGGAHDLAAPLERGRGETMFAGHRRYQSGDSPRHVDWKASARADRLLVIERADTSGPTQWLDYDTLAGQDRETRLSQLTQWIIAAEDQAVPYGLQLPGLRLGPARGRTHRQACLKALALF
ncbi:DUF58 domain-containing protein [Salinisphaera sp. SPP-AMP-43]|uniref:DUF58 domain-containing protein n=1 Tax=Salinisphaera sp. SPP-AMP-43 TaxID=3121288 RepID=UPI003C6DDB2B